MASHRKQIGEGKTDSFPDVESLLALIEQEQVPDRLLELAQELQRALNLRAAAEDASPATEPL